MSHKKQAGTHGGKQHHMGNAVARDIRLAEMLIAKRARPAEADLASPDVRLKKLLAA